MNTLARLQKYMEGRKALLPIALLVSALSAIMAMAPYMLIWFIIRELFTYGILESFKRINTYAWLALWTAIASIVLYFVALSCSHLAAFRVEVNLRREAMKKIIRMPLGFFSHNTTGSIRKIIDDNAGITHSFLAHHMPDLASSVIMPCIVLVSVFIFDWRLGMVCLIPIGFSLLIMRLMVNKRGKQFLHSYMNSLEKMNTEAVEYVRGIPVVKVFQQTVFSFKNFHNSIITYKNMVSEYTKMWEKPMSTYTVMINSFVFFLVPVAILIISHTGSYSLTILNLFLYVLITPVLSQSIMRSMYLNQALNQAHEAITRIESLTQFPHLLIPVAPTPMRGYSIHFDQVSFSYPRSEQLAIDRVSFSLDEGTTTALVGASGSGKTTIARLVSRFWDVNSGEIRIGNVPVKEIDPEQLMNHITFVFQNTPLFKRSILDNITYGNSEASLEEVEEAIDQAQCRQIIEKLPLGLYTNIGVEGTYLSGGEQQRIILARAILKKAPIIILDEATAFTDPENEHLIQLAFKKLTKGKTVLMIAHRLTSVTTVDTILVMDEGAIIEQGSHSVLLQKQGRYAHMYHEYMQSINWKIEKESHHA